MDFQGKPHQENNIISIERVAGALKPKAITLSCSETKNYLAMITQKVRARIIELRADGVSFAKIAEQVGCAKQTAFQICKDNKDRIQYLKAIEIETETSAFQEMAELKVEALKTMYNGLLEEIQERIESGRLCSIPTEDLFNLMLKLTSKMEIKQQELPNIPVNGQLSSLPTQQKLYINGK